MKFTKKDTFTEFWTNKDIVMSELHELVGFDLGLKKWEDEIDKEGYSGLVVDMYEDWKEKGLPCKYRVKVIWTKDGVRGFPIELPQNMIDKVKGSILKCKEKTPEQLKKPQGIE